MFDIKNQINKFLNTQIFWDGKSVGLDLGHYSLKMAFVDSGKGKVLNLKSKIIDIERENFDDVSDQDTIVNWLSGVLKEYQDTNIPLGNNVNTIYQDKKTISQYIELPPLKKAEIDTAIYSQAVRYIPFPIENVTLDYVVVPPLNHKKDKNAIFMVASLKEDVNKFSNILERCNIKIQRVESPAVPMTREFSMNHNLLDDKFYVLVHSGFKYTYVTIVRNGYPYYSREFVIAGRSFTYAFQMGEQCTWKEAEKYKVLYDTSIREPMVEPFLMRWLDEVKKSIVYFQNQVRNQTFKIERVYLSGGTSCWKNLDKRLSEHLEMPVIIDYLENLSESKSKKNTSEDNSGIFKPAIGLAFEKNLDTRWD